MIYKHPALPGHFWNKISINHQGCWIWLGARDKQGYGRLARKGKNHYVHRYVWKTLVGELTAESLDHLCRTQPCCNPHHLDPCSKVENARRGKNVITSINKNKTHCIRGHEFNKANTYLYANGTQRACRACRKSRREEKKRNVW